MQYNLDGNSAREDEKVPWHCNGKYNIVVRLSPEEYKDFKEFVRKSGAMQSKILRTAIKEFMVSRGFIKEAVSASKLKEEFIRLYEEETKNAIE